MRLQVFSCARQVILWNDISPDSGVMQLEKACQTAAASIDIPNSLLPLHNAMIVALMQLNNCGSFSIVCHYAVAPTRFEAIGPINAGIWRASGLPSESSLIWLLETPIYSLEKALASGSNATLWFPSRFIQRKKQMPLCWIVIQQMIVVKQVDAADEPFIC